MNIYVSDSRIFFEWSDDGDEKQIKELKSLLECLKNYGIELDVEYEGTCG